MVSLAGSIAGVPVIPSGSMLPQLSEERATGLPSDRLQIPPSERPRRGQGVSRMRVFKPIPERSAMTNRDPILPDAVIDIAKARIEASHHRRRRSVLDTRAEHNRLIEALKAYGRPVICAFEATGNYHRPMAWRLIEAGFDVRLVWRLAGREN
jgi:hypothetical protein